MSYDYSIKNCLHPTYKNCMHCDNFSICPPVIKKRTIKESLEIAEQLKEGLHGNNEN